MRISGSLTPLIRNYLTLLTLCGLAVSLGSGQPPQKWQTAVEMLKLNRLFGVASPQLLRRRLNGSADPTFPQASAQIINGCKIYSEAGTCLYCIRDSFLNSTSGTCQSIAYAQLIPNCNVYFNATTCYQCDNNNVVNPTSGRCIATSALPNCALQVQQGVCQQCVAGSFLASGACSTPLVGCAVASSAVVCQTCAVGYYLLNNGCVAVTGNSTVPNCATYGADQRCRACQKGYALDTDGMTCWDASQASGQIDRNCENTVINTGQYCNICRQGYYLNNGTCQRIPRDSAEGCFIADITQPTRCLICLTGFQIDLTDSCTFGGLSNPGIVDPLFSSIQRAVFALFLGLLMTN